MSQSSRTARSRSLRRSWLWGAIAAFLGATSAASAPPQGGLPATFGNLPDGFFEAFALAEDRGKTLEQLLPGTVEHAYFTCLHLQQQGQLDAVDGAMRAWRRSHGENSDYAQIEARQALLRASSDPAATFSYLEKELGLRFNDRRQVSGASPDAPTSLDSDQISTERLLAKALRRNSRSALKELDPALLETLVRRNLKSSQERWLLDLLPRPDVPGLVELVAKDLASNKGHSFGNRRIHERLTLAQLEQLRAARPAVLSNARYVNTVMSRLAPRFPETMDSREDRLAYLERAWDFVALLPSSFVSLKAHVLYHRLAFDLDGGDVDEERLMRYLRTPRSTRYYVRPRGSSPILASLGDAFDSVTPLAAIGQEEDLVTECLHGVFRSGGGFERYVGVLEESYVKRTFAEAKLLYGDARESDTYVKMLGAARAEALRARVDIEFARTNPADLEANERVTLAVDVKNVERMLVKVFEIDPVAYFDRFGSAVNSSLDLDGLVANDTRILEFDAPPMARVRRQIELDALTQPGTYVVELIGGGVSSRAVVVKGNLQLLERPTAAGHLLRVFDDAGEPVDGAVVRFGGRDYEPSDAGEILVPFTPAPSSKKVLLRHGGVSSVAVFMHRGESYRLQAAVHTPLEGLIAGEQATLVVRPTLELNRHRVPLGALDRASLLVTARTKDGVVSSQLFDGLELAESGELVRTITVPERIASIDVQLTGTVRSLTQGKDLDLDAGVTNFPVHRAHAESPFHSYLTETPEGFALDLLGRAGEPLVDAEVQIEFRHRLVGVNERVRLKTDERGRVGLGALKDIASVRLVSPGGLTNAWTMTPSVALGLPPRLHGVAGTDLRVPYRPVGGALTRSDAALLERDAGGRPLVDRFDALAFGNGYLILRGLGEGEYDLHLKGTGQSFRVSILSGEVRFRHVMGEAHALELTDPVPLQIVSVGKGKEELVVQLGGVSPSARVHVVATRYLEPMSALAALGIRPQAQATRTDFGGLFTTYESGREISDEYRYILDRRLIDPYPGNMLTRPGYLLNPWALRTTDDEMAAEGRSGSRFGGKRNLRAAGSSAGAPFDSPTAVLEQAGFIAPDFLASGAIVLTGLRPDGRGVVRIPVAQLGQKHMIQIVAVDDTVTVHQPLVRTESPVELRERRLVDALDSRNPMTQQRRIEFLDAGESYVIRDAPNAGARTFGSLSDVFELFRTSGAGGEELAKFDFLTRWPSLSEQEKRTKYSEYACHEVHIFLRERDPEFFQSIVVPHLSSKGHATFMDDWLLGRDLTAYLEPWQFERLNVVELILLLRETGGDGARITGDMLALLPPSAFSMDASFAEILASRGLGAGGGALSQAMEVTRKRAVAESLKSLGYSGPATPGPGRPSSGAGESQNDFFVGRSASARDEVSAVTAAPMEAPMADLEEADKESLGLSLDIAGSAGVELEARGRVEGFYYRDLDPTMEYAETHYWRVRLDAMGAGLITVSPFWVDFAKSGDAAFHSTSFPLANRSVTEKLLALAFLDLPFEGAEPEAAVNGRSVTLSATRPTFLALEDIASAAPQDGAPSVLVGQDFFDPANRTDTVDGVTRDRFVVGEFLKGRPYGCRMVVTNPSSMSVDLQLLIQIPEGAIALGGTHMTKGVPASLSSYGTTSIETLFYFPHSGSYRDYPVHAGRGSTLLGAADPAVLTVVDEVTQVDTSTWEWISQNAEVPALLAYLEGANPRSLDLGKIAWRMADRDDFVAITDALARRGVFHDRLWRYAIKHRDAVRAERYLERQESLVRRVGAPFSSPLMGLEPRRRGLYEHLAYEPLVNGRTHEFGGARKILNEQFRLQWWRFLGTLALGASWDAEDQVELVYYLLLQDRIAEALEAFGTIDASELRTRVQYDYMAAYMAFYRGEVRAARAAARPYADYPVDMWRARFRNVLAQADEIEGKGLSDGFNPDDREESQGALASAEPLLAVDVDGGQVLIGVEGMDELEVRFHRMDVEFLFSNSPFVRGGEGAFGVIRPTRTERLSLGEGQRAVVLELPDELRTANVVVEVRGGGISRQATYFAGELSVQGMERYGQVRVQAAQGGQALPRAYVKVYAQLENGETRFHKDGYTDLRGRFDYVSLSGVSGPAVTRYALLVMHEDAGASMLELAPPAR